MRSHISKIKIDLLQNRLLNGNFVVEACLCSSNTPEYSAVLVYTSPKNCSSQIGFAKGLIGRLVWAFLVSLTAWMESKAAPPSSLQRLKKGTYEENLAAYRIKCCKGLKVKKKETCVPLACPLDQTKHLAQRLAQRKVAYEHMSYLKGYTIQLYMGSSRTAALKTQDLVSTLAYASKLHYRQPHYTVQLGFFSDRLEAYFVYLTLVKKIGTAMIRPCMFPREEYVATMLQLHEP